MAKTERKAIEANGSDKDRWALPIFSTTSTPDGLIIELVRARGFTLRLDPKAGRISFDHPEADRFFEISRPMGDPKEICPVYNIQVLSASAVHALFEKVCRKFEYKPKRFSMGTTVFLYDVPTGTMRSIWRAEATGADDKLPYAVPDPAVKSINNGYEFKWSGQYPGNNGPTKVNIHNRFTRVKDNESGKLALQCRDMTVNGKAEIENEMCEGESLELISSKTK